MGLFDAFKKKTSEPAPVEPTPAPQAAPSAPAQSGGISLVKSGKLSLAKGEQVSIASSKVITARCLWPSTTDYDVYALVLLKDGTTKIVSTFGSEADRNPTPSILNGAVKHLGDVARGNGSMAEEIIEIRMTPEIEAVVPVVYSAQSNGSGSFRRHKVSCEISNGEGTQVTISADNASPNNTVYTVAVGIIRNAPEGTRIEALEEYSRPGSEFRPAIKNGKVVMDAGSKNLYK